MEYFKGTEKELIEEISKTIVDKYKVNPEKALALSRKLVAQILSHGGNPYNLNQLQKGISIIIKSWINE